MAQKETSAVNPFFRDFFNTGVYKRNQGRVTRQVTAVAIVLTICIGAWRLYETLITADPLLRYGLSGAVALLGVWAGYRMVNVRKFADFLIAVEAEMNKVSWPDRTQLVRSSLVVLFMIFALAALLFAYDNFWRFFLDFLGVLRSG